MSLTDGEGSAPDVFRVSDVMNPNFARSWHEAVAVVQEVAAQLAPGASVPGPRDLLLDAAGAVKFGSGAPLQQHPVTSLGMILQRLLEGIDAPPALRDFAAENAKPSPSHATVVTFQSALAFYERPARASDLQALVSRLRENPPPPSPEGEFELLRERVVARAEAAPVTAKPQPRPGMNRQFLIAAAVILLAVVGALAVYARPKSAGTAGAATSLTGRVEQKVADTIAAGLTKLGVTAGTKVKPEATLAEAPEPAGRSGKAAARPHTAAAAKTGDRNPVTGPNAQASGQRAAGGNLAAAPGSGDLRVPGITDMWVAPFVEGPSIVELGGVVHVLERGPRRRAPAPEPSTVAARAQARGRHRLLRCGCQRDRDRRAGPADLAEAPVRGTHVDGGGEGVAVQARDAQRRAGALPRADCDYHSGKVLKSHFLQPLLRRDAPPLALRNQRTGRVVAVTVEPALDSASRKKGLLGRDGLPEGHALIIAPSGLVHTFGMRFAIDVLIVSRAGVVLKAAAAVPARRVVGAWRGFAVVEMRAGSLVGSGTSVGDGLSLCERTKVCF